MITRPKDYDLVEYKIIDGDNIKNIPALITKVKGIIYSIYCKSTEKYYIGQTLSHRYMKKNIWVKTGVNIRCLTHKNRKFSRPLYDDIQEYGWQDFVVEIEAEYNGKEIVNLSKYETATIKNKNSLIPNGYNERVKSVASGRSRKRILWFYDQNPLEYEQFSLRPDGRSTQICLAMESEEKKKFFQTIAVSKIRITLINSKGKADLIRLMVYVFGEKDSYRHEFRIKDNIEETFTTALKFAQEITKKIEVAATLENLINGIDATYEYQEKLNFFDEKNIVSATGSKYYHKGIDSYTYIIFLRDAENKKHRMTFGGRKLSIDDAYKKAGIFVKKLNEISPLDFTGLNKI